MALEVCVCGSAVLPLRHCQCTLFYYVNLSVRLQGRLTSPHCQSAGDCVTVQLRNVFLENIMTEEVLVLMIKDDGFNVTEFLCVT